MYWSESRIYDRDFEEFAVVPSETYSENLPQLGRGQAESWPTEVGKGQVGSGLPQWGRVK
jgi:hypothetical protein